ncbi:hypothetical protein PsYK624_101460 [Phanerochaete sordida]|uniref:DUF6534 domain-containing protein n=1 Tax=Phanerochaete sordida TaxID=48140 RepID=A0A9P3GI09_9APHY|nr:hypothetical protein PsYK624_101460 [Phanerochaete sordida]
MLPPTLPTALPPLDNTLGAIVIAAIMIAVLYGITSVQAYIYLHRPSSDGRAMKNIVLVLWLLHTLVLAFVSQTIYYYSVTSFMNPLALKLCPWSFAANMVAGEVLESTVTFVFAYKIYKLSGSLKPLIFIMPPPVICSVGAFAIVGLVLKNPSFDEFEDRYAWLWYASFGLQAFSDCTITAALVVLLIKRRTGFKRTDSIIHTLTVYCINTCALTSAVSLASVITNAVMPRNFIHIAFAQVLPTLMCNSLLALLNSRDTLYEARGGQVVSVHLSRLRGAFGKSAALDGARARKAHGVELVGKGQDILNVSQHATESSVDLEPVLAEGIALAV